MLENPKLALRGLRHRYGLLRTPPVNARHAERSMIYSADDDARPSERLLDIALEAIATARANRLDDLPARVTDEAAADLWPGEHYRLLPGLVEAVGAKTVVEIGTATGLSALTLLRRLPADGRLATFDIVPWDQYPGGVLKAADFADGRLEQHTDDLSTPEGLARHRELLAQADLIFVDAAKEGGQEERFLANFEQVAFERAPIVVFDDIRVWNMLAVWRSIQRPKLDLTSFGHWSGTGLVDWS